MLAGIGIACQRDVVLIEFNPETVAPLSRCTASAGSHFQDNFVNPLHCNPRLDRQVLRRTFL